MKIKPALCAVEFVQAAAIVFTLVSLYCYVRGFADFNFINLAIGGLGAVVLITLLKGRIIRFILFRVAYPGIFFDLCERLRLVQNLSVNESDAVLDDLYFPKYETSRFLAQNKLSPKIQNAQSTQKNAIGIVVMVFSLSVMRFGRQLPGWSLPVFFFSLIGIVKYVVPKRGKGKVVYTFAEEGLITEDETIPWQLIYDWSVNAEFGRGSGIAIQLTTLGQELILTPDHLSHSKVEILMLLAHYKNKYGRVEG